MSEISPTVSHGMRPQAAQRRIAVYAKRFGDAHLYLAYHAAFPLVLTPDLLYRLRANFQLDIYGNHLNIPWIAVADLLLSSLCDEVGYELYEMHVAIRSELLKQLKAHPDFGPQRIGELSNFLLKYVQQQLNSPEPDTRDLAQSQSWMALAATKPDEAARKVALTLSALDAHDRANFGRMRSLIEALLEPSDQFATLLAYTKGMEQYAHGNQTQAQHELSKVNQGKQTVSVSEVELPIPEQLQPKTEQPSLPTSVDTEKKISTTEKPIGNKQRLTPGTTLSSGRYTIEKLIAVGSSSVYRALDTHFKRPCAVKELLDEFQNDAERLQAVQWFNREATLLLDLHHSCIPRIRDFFEERDRYYLVMDFVEGRTLSEILEKEGTIVGVNGARGVSEARTRGWAQQLCNVLSYLHSQSPPVIFRGLKPSNVMVTSRDEVKLVNFGIARTFQPQNQATITMNVGYSPPEQLQGKPEPRSDIYALGATLHRVLTHHDAANNKPSLFTFPPIRTLRPDVSPEFGQIVMKALQPNLEQRWASAAEMERAILALADQGVVGESKRAGAQPASYYPQLGDERTESEAPETTTTYINAATYISAALGFINTGRFDDAYTAASRAYALEPGNALVHKIYGQVFARRQPPNIDLAERAYTYSLQLDPNDAETHKLLGDVWLFLRKQPAQAMPHYKESLRLKADDAKTHQYLARCYEQTNQLDKALGEYKEAARLAPENPSIHYALGRLAQHMKNWPIATRAFVQVLMLNPADYQTRFLLSQVYESANKITDAYRECGYVVRGMPENQQAQEMLQRLKKKLVV